MEECKQMDFDPILVTQCEDCGYSLVLEPEIITLYELDGDFTVFTLCSFCDRPLTDEISKDIVKELIMRGVKILSWTDKDYKFNA